MAEHFSVALARARQRWLVTVLLAIGTTALVFSWRVRHPRTFDASIVVRVVESDFDPASAPPAPGELERVIRAVYLTRTTLRSLIERHGLYAEQTDTSLALETMRDDLEVRVVQNYFSPEQYLDDPVRSARIVIAYQGRTPDRSYAVVRDLGERIARDETRLRIEASRRAAASAEVAKRELTRRLLAAHRRRAELNLTRDVTTRHLVELAGVAREIAQIESELAGVSDRSTRLALRRGLETQHSGMRFELVDAGSRPRGLLDERQHRTLVGMLAFVLILPVTALVVGTLSGREHRRTLRGVWTTLGRRRAWLTSGPLSRSTT